MIYLPKGIVQKGSTEQLLFVLYGSQKFELTGNAAAAWLNGRFNFAEALGRIFCPADKTKTSVFRAMDKEILQWLKNAGVRLTVAELESQISQTASQRKAQQDHRQAVLFLPYVSRTF